MRLAVLAVAASVKGANEEEAMVAVATARVAAATVMAAAMAAAAWAAARVTAAMVETTAAGAAKEVQWAGCCP